MHKNLIRAFSDELNKIAAGYPTASTLKAEAHFGIDKKDWKTFEKNLRSKTFQEAILSHPDSDHRLQAYVTQYGGYLKSKDVVANSPSRSSGKVYKIKRLPDGRLGCGCKAWQYICSVEGTDCFHIKQHKMKEKNSNAYAQMGRGVALMRGVHKNKAHQERGKVMQENVKRLRAGAPLVELPR